MITQERWIVMGIDDLLGTTVLNSIDDKGIPNFHVGGDGFLFKSEADACKMVEFIKHERLAWMDDVIVCKASPRCLSDGHDVEVNELIAKIQDSRQPEKNPTR